ncbi:MAG: glucose-6-phosphate isomerase [Gammaproteobacteria bacterium]|nr:glucose-6-phosphate isomerase [Gammaproteobacteria bacterium]
MDTATSATHEPLVECLFAHARRLSAGRIDGLFVDPARADAWTIDAAGLCFDHSKQLLDAPARDALLALAHARALPARIEDLFRGGTVNPTEGRAALHTALRDPDDDVACVDGRPVGPEIRATLTRLREVVDDVLDGRWRGHGGARITDVVNLGIGGSHLGPQLVVDALRYVHTGAVRVHFVSNVDGGDIDRVLCQLDPATTLFIVASKSFTTPETALNALSAQAWILAHFAADTRAIAAHFFAITAHPQRAVEFGIARDKVLPMWDWVGGRYSLWSAIGLPIALAIGYPGFMALLAGARAMDAHFRSAPLAHNAPVMLALCGLWNTNFLGAGTHAIVPYDERLRLLPDYLQQLEMESNGKRVTLDAEAVPLGTAPVVWGGIGTNVQHAFFQMLHQGTRLVPVDFMLALRHPRAVQGHHDMLVANCFAQSEALMVGRTREALRAAGADPTLAIHREQPGNQPSNTIVMDELTPATLGALLALYEHKTFVQGVLWQINSFDQWGVELGKQLAAKLLDELAAGHPGIHDGSTTRLMERYLARRSGVRDRPI